MCLCFKHARLLDSFFFFFLSFCFAFSRFCVSGVYAYACFMHAHILMICVHIQLGCVCMPYVCTRMSLPKNPNPFLHVFLLFYSNVLVAV